MILSDTYGYKGRVEREVGIFTAFPFLLLKTDGVVEFDDCPLG